MISKYLSDLGIKENQLPYNWSPNDSRGIQWAKQRKEYGFDERETWNLDTSFYLWAYPRLKMFDEINIINTEIENVVFDGNTYTLQQCINIILEGWEIALIDNFQLYDKEKINKILLANKIFGHILHSLWW